jgi:hypothetical protein
MNKITPISPHDYKWNFGKALPEEQRRPQRYLNRDPYPRIPFQPEPEEAPTAGASVGIVLALSVVGVAIEIIAHKLT